MILTGDLHASPEELQFLSPGYLKEKYGSKAENTIIVILGDGGFLWHDDPYSDFDVGFVSGYDIFYIVVVIIDEGLDADGGCFAIVGYLLVRDIDVV